MQHETEWAVFINGKIVTLDGRDSVHQAVAVKGDRIFAVGSSEEIRHLAGDAEPVDLGGKTVLPGLIDPHTHLGFCSLSVHYYVDGRCPPNKSLGDILERIDERAKCTPKGNWIVTHLSMFGDQKLAEKRYPTRQELDEAAPDHPVILQATVHKHIANTRALKLLGITRDYIPPPGGSIERDPRTGEPTGVLTECSPLMNVTKFTYKQRKEAIVEAMNTYWLKQGLTTVHSFADADEFKIYQDLAEEGHLPLRVQALPMSVTLGPGPMIDSLTTLGLRPGLGNERLKLGGVKIFTDGAFMGLSAGTYEPYLNLPEHNYCGLMRFDDPSQYNQLVQKAHDAGLQLCIHAIGDKAQDWALNAYETALNRNPRPHRHRIEHFGNVMTSPQRIRRARALDIIPVTTVEWLYAYGDFIERYLGPEMKKQSFVLRSLIDAGLRPANCSDCAGTEPRSINPFFSIWCAVARHTFFGNTLVPEESISVKEALHLYTRNAAYAGFEEETKGSIEPGKLADLIVIDRDILTVPEEQIKDTRVEMTVVDGKIVYTRE
jgi:predicted amidohydrolase YtcJ